jgi:hypothetical protein
LYLIFNGNKIYWAKRNKKLNVKNREIIGDDKIFSYGTPETKTEKCYGYKK